MNARNDNEPAFPVSTSWREGKYFGHQDGNTTWQFSGMSLRDYFAAKAMQVEIQTACHSVENAQALVGAAEEGRRTIEQQIAHNAYSMADAMLAERNKS